ncbi:3-hydroxy-3-methylglutaryl-coenzyme A reductase 1-like isoform X2 [Anneissia japonica]|uniref:3-hydroxy-3-methylglutaryl-coenzyme A reductase 1-like isoform X2 n=1 Tax=Anneissia japonica TaxID=1529436 RepID=UPI0014256F9F|nr:3-hydroxy-3-methylglutaryl-coenzyme A reductase 1-like isoform X2 [Anneissia japonica]
MPSTKFIKKLRPKKKKDKDKHKGSMTSLAETQTQTPSEVETRKEYITESVLSKVNLDALNEKDDSNTFKSNIENYIGTVKVPVGAVQVKVNGSHANGSYTVPLATTETSLVGTCNRGCQLINMCGGIESVVMKKQVQSAPIFQFENLRLAVKFDEWLGLPATFESIKVNAIAVVEEATLVKLEHSVHGNSVYSRWYFDTGDAVGQNISTYATKEAMEEILKTAPVQPSSWDLDVGLARNRQAATSLMLDGRGVYVTGEVVCPKEKLEEVFHVSAEKLASFSRESRTWQLISHTAVSSNIHLEGSTYQSARVIAAILVASGLDAAAVVESHVGITDMKLTKNGDLRVIVTLPSLMVGTTGGGTKLPSQQACLQIIDLPEENSREAFAEVVLAAVMGGEIGMCAAMVGHHFFKTKKRSDSETPSTSIPNGNPVIVEDTEGEAAAEQKVNGDASPEEIKKDTTKPEE